MSILNRHAPFWPFVAIGFLVLGLLAASPATWTSVRNIEVVNFLLDPKTVSLVLLVAAVATAWWNLRLASITCRVAATLWAISHLGPLGVSPGSGVVPLLQQLPLLACAGLGIGMLLFELPAAFAWRITASAVVCMTAICAAAVYLFALGLMVWESGDTAPTIIHAAAFIGIAVSWFHCMVRQGGQWHILSREWIAAMIAITGLCVAGAAYYMMSRSISMAGGNQVGALLVITVLVLCLAAAMVSAFLASTTIHDLASSNQRFRDILNRQRRMNFRRASDLRRSRAWYQALFRDVPAAVVLTRADGEIVAANDAFIELLGMKSEESLLTRNMASFYADPSERDSLVESLRHSDRSVHRGELVLRHCDGRQILVIHQTRTLRAKDRTIDLMQSTMTDITELRRAEEERKQLEANLRLAQKLDAVGRLAAGIAHEINTPLQYIGDNIYYVSQAFGELREYVGEQQKLLDDTSQHSPKDLPRLLTELREQAEIDDIFDVAPGALERAREGVDVVSHTVSAMKELAHPGQGNKASTDINHLIDTALTVTRNEYKTVAEVEAEYGELPNVLVHRTELCQVVINLVINAVHAIEEAKKTSPRDGYIQVTTWRHADHVCIGVADNGCGIPESVLEKIFDPFFTTKSVGMGTGQGLAIARATVVDQHGGDLRVNSEVGVGTEFTILIPTVESGSDGDAGEKEGN